MPEVNVLRNLWNRNDCISHELASKINLYFMENGSYHAENYDDWSKLFVNLL